METLLDTFHVSAEDGSSDQMGRLLYQLYIDCVVTKDYAGLEQLLQYARTRAKAEVQCFREGAEDGDDDALMMSDIEEDEDDDAGWDYGDDDDDDDGIGGKIAEEGADEDDGVEAARAGLEGVTVTRGRSTATAPDEDGWSTVVETKPRRR
jgi:hypothetical protein